MSPYDDFIHISTGPPNNATTWPGGSVSRDYFDHSKGLRTSTEAVIIDSIIKNHPKHHLTSLLGEPGLLGFAQDSDDISITPTSDQSIVDRFYAPPARRVGDVTNVTIINVPVFVTYEYKYKGTNFLLYIVHGEDAIYPSLSSFLLTPIEDDNLALAQEKADRLLEAAVRWAEDLHGEVLVFDGFWAKNKDLFNNIQKANWEDVILEKERKETIINDVLGFFNSGERYLEFGVPWKRGVIFYGPPGNGKTISTKALMHDVSKKISPTISNLYVKTFNTWQGPEAGIRMIFEKARQQAPCLLVFEDIDSLVNPDVRAYFLNEVDGLESNHGILMIGSTNHLERLDPGIAKRPSRFDRKYLFDDPNEGERELYAEYWRHKLSKNKKIDFPKLLSGKIASATKGFSFAYIKEAFVAALLVIVARGDEDSKSRGDAGPMVIANPSTTGGGGDEFENNLFWKELKKQIDNLRREMDDELENVIKAKGARESDAQRTRVSRPSSSTTGIGGLAGGFSRPMPWQQQGRLPTGSPNPRSVESSYGQGPTADLARRGINRGSSVDGQGSVWSFL